MDITQRLKSSNLDKARQANRTFESRLKDDLEEIARARCLALYAITRESTDLLVENQQRSNEKFNLSLRRSLESAPAGQRQTPADTGRRCGTSDGPWRTRAVNSSGVKIHSGNDGSGEASDDDFARRTRRGNAKAVTFDKPPEFERNTNMSVGSRTIRKEAKVRNDRIMDAAKARRERTPDAGKARRDRTLDLRHDASSLKHPSRRKSTARKNGGGHFNQDYRGAKRGGLKSSRSGGCRSPPSQQRIIRFCTLFSSSNSHRQQNQGLEEGKLKLRPPRRRLGLGAALGEKDEEQAVLLRLRRLSQARENAALEERVQEFLDVEATGDGTPQRKPLARRSSSVIPQDEDERLLEMFKNLVLPRGSSARKQTLQSL